MRRECAVCGTGFEAKRPQARYCGETCKKRAQRGGIATPATPAPVVNRAVSGLVDAVEAELEAAGKLNSMIGQHAMELANRIVSAPGMNAGVASLSKELSRVMAEALKVSTAKANPLDELRARRDAKRAAG